MPFKLSKFVGRDQLPGDEVAFDRISAAFESVGSQRSAISKVGFAQRELCGNCDHLIGEECDHHGREVTASDLACDYFTTATGANHGS